MNINNNISFGSLKLKGFQNVPAIKEAFLNSELASSLVESNDKFVSKLKTSRISADIQDASIVTKKLFLGLIPTKKVDEIAVSGPINSTFIKLMDKINNK